MIANGECLAPTRASGIAAYGVALTTCGIVWARAKGVQSVRKIAAWLTAIEGVLLLDMIVDGRWVLHHFFVNIAQNQHEYDLRSFPQLIVVTILVGILLVSLFFSFRLLSNKDWRSPGCVGSLIIAN
jgi:hypothetical protein